mmetsp:Transcript_8272/g.17810  ORF Transcript_8272/g.17810 Transcript_8272/m.17810 type:complete len:443 (+) Transcript_8272:521-1849(+)
MTAAPGRDAADPLLGGRVVLLLQIYLAVELLVRHGVHYDEELPELLRALVVPALGDEVFRHARHHPHHAVERTHLRHALELLVQVPQCELSLGHVLHHLLPVLPRIQTLDLLHEAPHVAESQQLRHERLGVERLEVLEPLAAPEEDDGTPGGGHGADGPAAPRVAVELRHDDAPHVHGRVERAGLVVHGLTLRGVHDEYRVAGVHRGRYLLHLLEQALLLPVPARRVDDDDLVAVLDEPVHSLLGDGDRVGLGVAPVEWHPELGSVLLELVERPRAEGVGADHRGLPAPPQVVVRELGDGRRLPGALESHEEDHVGPPPPHDVGLRAPLARRGEHRGQLVDDGPLDLAGEVGVARRRVLRDGVADLPPDVVLQVRHELGPDVRLGQCLADVPEDGVERLGGYGVVPPAALEAVEGRAELPAEFREDHRRAYYNSSIGNPLTI